SGMLAKPCPCGGAGTLTLPVEPAPAHCPLCRGMAFAESRIASRRTHRQLWGREKMKFEPLRQTKDLAGASEGNQTATRALANTETAATYAKRITRRALLFSLLAQICSQTRAPAWTLSLFSLTKCILFSEALRCGCYGDQTPGFPSPPGRCFPRYGLQRKVWASASAREPRWVGPGFKAPEVRLLGHAGLCWLK